MSSPAGTPLVVGWKKKCLLPRTYSVLFLCRSLFQPNAPFIHRFFDKNQKNSNRKQCSCVYTYKTINLSLHVNIYIQQKTCSKFRATTALAVTFSFTGCSVRSWIKHENFKFSHSYIVKNSEKKNAFTDLALASAITAGCAPVRASRNDATRAAFQQPRYSRAAAGWIPLHCIYIYMYIWEPRVAYLCAAALMREQRDSLRAWLSCQSIG